ncbi:uncharacterized protein LOC114760798 [Neltuma alba]|uniref:uncharacterized protein LOC114760798 n=1 Tax=Neltuma alba TaxID=207710 RepID=UPI0010A533F9|nr:uncharacterized protein LOC114760798 [Prosopis alba]
MGTSTDLFLHTSPYYTHDGAAPKVKALFVHVRTSASDFNDTLPQFLTVLFNSSNSSLSLHRLLNHPLPHSIFAAKLSICLRRRRRQRPSQPFSFQLFHEEVLLLKGALIEQKNQRRWTLDCKSQVHLLQSYSHPISELQLCFAFDDGNLAATNWVRLANPKERIKQWVISGGYLEQIPEEMELPSEDSHEVLEDLERLRRSVDLGIWVLFLGVGVGYLVSRASARKFRPHLNL